MSRYDDILRDLPAGLTEADLIDMVDGSVSAEREPVVIAALRAQPRLGIVVKQLRGDRVALEATMGGAESAPAGMMDAIQAKLDREAQSALVHEAEEATAPIPISSVQVRSSGRGVIRVLAESVWARRLATAASIAIVGGLGAIAARELMRKWPKLPGTVPVAVNEGGGATDAVGPTATDHHGTAIAASGAVDGTTGAEPTAMKIASSDTAPVIDTPVADDAPLTAAEAVRLAQEGRLVITVRSKQLPGTLKHLESLARAGTGDTRWRSHDLSKLPGELAMLATPLPDPTLDVRPPMSPTFVGPSLPAFASEDGGTDGPRAKTGGDEGSPLGAWSPQLHVRAVRMVRMDAEARALDELLRDLNISKDQVAAFRVLPSPLEQRPSLDAESMLWWASGPEAWTQKIVLPIVVETVE